MLFQVTLASALLLALDHELVPRFHTFDLDTLSRAARPLPLYDALQTEATRQLELKVRTQRPSSCIWAADSETFTDSATARPTPIGVRARTTPFVVHSYILLHSDGATNGHYVFYQEGPPQPDRQLFTTWLLFDDDAVSQVPYSVALQEMVLAATLLLYVRQ
jgi:hypothetical protein